MFQHIFVPNDVKARLITVVEILVERRQRVYRGDVLMVLSADQNNTSILSPKNGFVSYIMVKPHQVVEASESLLVMDFVEVSDYHPDEQQVNPHTELGEHGRRALERDLQKQYANGFSAPLFEAPSPDQGEGSRPRLPAHPLLQKMKEGVPPKMRANAASNSTAIERTAEDANHDPALQKQLSQQLQAELGIRPTPTNAPKLTL